MRRRDLLTLGLAGAAGLALAGCGFRLRGLDQAEAPLPELALSGDGELARLIQERLAATGTRVHGDAPLVLHLGPERFVQRRLSVLASGPRDEEMSLLAPFSLQRRHDGAYLLGQQTLEATTRYRVDDDLLASDDRRADARETLRQAVVRQLLERLRSL